MDRQQHEISRAPIKEDHYGSPHRQAGRVNLASGDQRPHRHIGQINRTRC